MSDEETLRERLERVLELINTRADAEIALGESTRIDQVGFTSIGFGTGARFARDLIQGEFAELFPDEAYSDE